MALHVGFGVVKIVHDLATAVWVGGLAVLGLVVVPAVRSAGAQARTALEAVQKRLTSFVYPSMALLVVSGLLLSRHSPAFRGFFAFGDPYSALLAVKHLLVASMVSIGLVRSLVFVRRGGRPGRERLKMGLLYVNMLLGFLVVVLSGLGAALVAP